MAYAGEEIVNPRTGQRMIFRTTAADSNGALLRIETMNPAHSPAEPVHVHPCQESSAEVLSGALHFRVRGEDRIVGPGETIVIPPNVPHNFWNEGDVDARAIQEFRPALRTEAFFETYFGLARDGKLDQRGMPSMLQMAVFVPAFANEMRLASPPWPLLRAFAAIRAPIARLRGYRGVRPYRPRPA